jgi:hypothetical protein
MPLFGIVLSLTRLAARAVAERTARNALRSAARGAIGRNATLGLRAADLVEEAAELEQQASDIVEAAYYEAMKVMSDMVGNPGQQVVYNDYIIPAFAEAVAESNIEDGWNDVDIGEYMVFMGEIVGEGNAIMEAAYQEAEAIAGEVNAIVFEVEEMEFEEGDSEDNEDQR